MAAEEGAPVSSIVTRILVGGLAGLAVAWAFFATPIFWKQAPIESISRHIIAEDSFKIEVLTSIKANYVDQVRSEASRTSVLSAATVINLRLLELEVARGDQRNLDSLMRETDEMIRKSLVNSPADPFLWTVLFWLENTRNGFKRAHLKYLKMSYSIGPNEGWVAVKRARFALALFPSLTPDLMENVVSEYSRLVGSNYFVAAADILEGPGWPIREALMSGLKDVDEISRQSFAKLIYRRGFDLAVPGVDRPDWRPWH